MARWQHGAGMSVRIQEDAASSAQACRPLPPRRFFGNRYVYCVVSERARGLSVGLNLNPDKLCNFDCVYCEIDRTHHERHHPVKVSQLVEELDAMLATIHSGRLDKLGYFPPSPDMLPFREVAFSGDGEPTLCPEFRRVVEAVVHLRARHRYPFFKLVLITNTTGLPLPEVRAGLELFAPEDEVWAKLDAGTQAYMDLVNAADIPLERVLANIADFARRRPVVIQSLFPAINGVGPSEEEIVTYANRLRELKDEGAQISLVQIYSAHRPAIDAMCGHLPLRTLSKIARTVRRISGLEVEVF